jgi:hypothetical protein
MRSGSSCRAPSTLLRARGKIVILITLQSTVRRRPDALAADVGGEVVLMSVEHGKYYGLDRVASDVWRRLEQPIAVAELCSLLRAEYAGDPDQIAREVVTLLEQLDAWGFLEGAGNVTST